MQTKQNESGLNITNVNRIGLKRIEYDQFGPIGPNTTNVDQIAKWIEEEKMDLIENQSGPNGTFEYLHEEENMSWATYLWVSA